MENYRSPIMFGSGGELHKRMHIYFLKNTFRVKNSRVEVTGNSTCRCFETSELCASFDAFIPPSLRRKTGILFTKLFYRLWAVVLLKYYIGFLLNDRPFMLIVVTLRDKT